MKFRRSTHQNSLLSVKKWRLSLQKNQQMKSITKKSKYKSNLLRNLSSIARKWVMSHQKNHKMNSMIPKWKFGIVLRSLQNTNQVMYHTAPLRPQDLRLVMFCRWVISREYICRQALNQNDKYIYIIFIQQFKIFQTLPHPSQCINLQEPLIHQRSA